MPRTDFAFICDHVRVESGIAHVLAAGIDSVVVAEVPIGMNLGFCARIEFSRHECGRPHRFELFFQGEDGGDPLMSFQGTTVPEWVEGQPAGWQTGVMVGLNLGVPLPAYGVYSFEFLLDDSLHKSVRLRVMPPPPTE